MFDATDWIIAEEASGTPLDLRRQLDPEVTRKLSFISGGGTKPLFFVEGTDRLDVQATRGVRELTPTSARFLDEIIELTDGRPPSDHLLNVNSQMLRENRASELIFAEEVRRGQAYAEGAVTRVTVNRYERDPRARQACINHYGARCIVCCLDFAASYGDVMSGFIHVHHVVPLSTIGSEYELDPVRDLRPVCPNCHAVIHRRETPYSVDEVRDLYRHRGTH
ncbi:MAG: HNH endonuclease [Deltaproteobacteria bacterium]|nr:HNH endonuclease [Deltaproteobacteria bacterium]